MSSCFKRQVREAVGATETVASFVARLRYEDLPLEVVRKVKNCVLDLFGVAAAGSTTSACRITTRFAVEGIGLDAGPCVLIGRTERAPYATASFINAVAGSALDMEDDATWGHPASVIIPVALAVGEAVEASGKEFVTAVAAAYEVSLRVADARVPSTILSYATGPWGVFGAAVAAAKLMRLSVEHVVHAIGIAAAHAPVRPPSRTYRYVPMFKECIGWAALAGVSAAGLAASGFTGFTDVLDYEQFYRPAEIVRTLGHHFMLLDVGFKPYSSCRWSHSAIDAVLSLVRENGLKADEIDEVRVAGFERASVMDNPTPESIEAAQYSIPFCLAAAILDGEVGPRQVREDRLEDQSLRSLAERVRVVMDENLQLQFPQKLPVVVKIRARGQTFEKAVFLPRGDKDNPLSEEELVDKFKRLAEPILGQVQSERLIELVANLEGLDNVRCLGDCLTVSEPRAKAF